MHARLHAGCSQIICILCQLTSVTCTLRAVLLVGSATIGTPSPAAPSTSAASVLMMMTGFLVLVSPC